MKITDVMVVKAENAYVNDMDHGYPRNECIRSALSAALSVGPEPVVKALEWRAERDGRWKTGVKPNSFKAKNYHVFLSKHDGRWHIDDGHFTFFRRSFSSLSSAQGAAQDDFEMNILKSLEPWS